MVINLNSYYTCWFLGQIKEKFNQITDPGIVCRTVILKSKSQQKSSWHKSASNVMFVELSVNPVGIRINCVMYLSIWSRLRRRLDISRGVLETIGTGVGIAADALLMNLGTVATRILLGNNMKVNQVQNKKKSNPYVSLLGLITAVSGPKCP